MAVVNVESPVAGAVRELLASPGASVAAAEELLIVESMKMEIPIEAPAGGVLLEYLVAPGQAIEESQVVARIEA